MPIMETACFTAVPLGLSVSALCGQPLLCTNITRRPRVYEGRSAVPRMCEKIEDKKEDEKDWRDVRAALHFGSAAAFEERKKSCYRPGHWAHPVRTYNFHFYFY